MGFFPTRSRVSDLSCNVSLARVASGDVVFADGSGDLADEIRLTVTKSLTSRIFLSFKIL